MTKKENYVIFTRFNENILLKHLSGFKKVYTKNKYFWENIILSILVLGALLVAASKLPRSNGYACISNSLSFSDYAFFFIFSTLVGTNLSMLTYLLNKKKHKKVATAETLGISGLILAILSFFCFFCLLPSISILGFGISLGFLSNHSLNFRIFSLLFLLISAFLFNKKVERDCKKCK